MFAGAAREAVFSTPEVIRRVNAEFVPVSVKAALLHQPGTEAEGRLMQAIGRSGPAPQGLCVLNTDGQVLDWVMMFDNEQAVLDFLDHALKQFAEHPDGQRDLATERFMRFPSLKIETMTEPAKFEAPPAKHAAGHDCPQAPAQPAGTLAVRVQGRAQQADGKWFPDTTRQEHYSEDRFTISTGLQKEVAESLAGAKAEPVKLPEAFARLLTQHAYLGQLDVQPLQNPRGAEAELRRCEFWAQRDAQSPGLFRLAGQTEVKTGVKQRQNDGATFYHEISLGWAGILELDGPRLKQLLATARGAEKLQWGSATDFRGDDVSRLPAGRHVDLAGGVRYGIVAEPAPVGQR